jgi:alpha-mannosidase
VPHAEGWVEGDLVHRAESLNVPPIVREVDAHPGAWPAVGSLASCAPANIVLTVVKLAEEGDDLIMRGYETAGRETEAEIAIGLDGARFNVTWKPHEIKTLCLERGATALTEVSMLEEPRE